jgi:DNA-binding NarL/FixJ family response regulator
VPFSDNATSPVHEAGLVSLRYPLRVLVVDDSASFLDAARDFLGRDGVAIVGVASTTAEALDRVRELRPDVALVDVDLGSESGFDLAQRLSSETAPADPRVILISSHAEDDFADLLASSPAVGFLSKADLSSKTIYEVVTGTDSGGHIGRG